jgi:hypothetical protein
MMTAVGFKFTKIVAEKKNVSENNLRIENNVGVTNVEEISVLDPKKSLLKFTFGFSCKYEPGLGTIELFGELVEMFDKDLSNRILNDWNNEKRLHQEIMARVLNNILGKANVEAIIISKELGLPSPIAMPKVEVKPKVKAEEPKAEAKKEEKKAEKKK